MAAVMLQVVPIFLQSNQVKTFSFLQKHTRNKLCAQSTELPTTTRRCAFPRFADLKFYCLVTLKSCYRFSTHCISHINTSTFSLHSSSIDPLEILLSRAANCLILRKKKAASIKEKDE